MKIDWRIVLAMLIGMFFLQNFFLKKDNPVDDVVVEIPEKEGGVEKELLKVIRDTVYIEVPSVKTNEKVVKQIVVDSLYKEKYETAIKENDSIKAKNLFLESISIDEYKGTLIDNKDIRILGTFTTRGKLLEYDIDYTIKKNTITYTPKTIVSYPKLTVTGSIEVGLPTTVTGTDPLISAKLGFINKKGKSFTLGVDSQKRVLVGYSVPLFRTKK